MARSQSPGELEDFFKEFEDIESNKAQYVEEEDTAKTPDEGEQEAAWLHNAGYGFLVHRFEAGKELTDDEIHALTSELPSNHAAVVKKRVDTLNATLQKRKKYTTKIDVRNIFPQQQQNSGKVVIHSEVAEEPPPSTLTAKQQPVRPTTLPRGMKFSSNGDSGTWNTQISNCPVDPNSDHDLNVNSLTFDLHHNTCITDITNKGHSQVSHLPSCPLSSDLDNDNVLNTEAMTPLRSRSDSQYSGNSINSRSRSKSSSCDTLDSLDSGLESASNRDNLGSKDSLIKEEAFDESSCICYELGNFSPSCGTSDPFNWPSSPIEGPETPDEFPPTLVACRKWKNTVQELPKSPTSPRNEVVHPEWANNRQNRASKGLSGSFVKNKGGYSMSGVTEEVQGNLEIGVEMLRMHQKDVLRHRDSQLSPISDSDITFEFSIEEHGNNGYMHDDRGVPKSMHGDNLPNYRVIEDKLGITRIWDISEADLSYVRKSALLDLTSLFDENNITYSRRRSKKRYKESGIFGVPLHVMVENDQKLKPNVTVPIVFTDILTYLTKHCLETEGILRVPGSSSRVKQLRHELEERFYQGTFIWADDLTPNDVAALMKQFLRELPIPLLTDDYIEAFAQIENLPGIMKQIHALNLLILSLPTEYRDTLHALLKFLEQVVSYQHVNKMTLNNVAMIMAPNLFLAPKVHGNVAKSRGSWELEFKMAAGTSNIMKMLVKYKDILWTVPSFTMAHLRRQNELEQIRKNKDKSKMKFLAKKDKTDVYKKPAVKQEADFQKGVIRIQAPNLTKSSTAIQLDTHMTAGDIVAKFKVIEGSQSPDHKKKGHHQKLGDVVVDTQNFTSAGEDTYLFEVGGNIGERCLPNNTNMLALYQTNPNAEWIIKQSH